MHQAFTTTGKAELEQPEPFNGDGHGVCFLPGGLARMVERYLAQRLGPAG